VIETLKCVGFDPSSIIQVLQLGVTVLWLAVQILVGLFFISKRKKIFDSMSDLFETLSDVIKDRIHKEVSPEERLQSELEDIEKKLKARADIITRVAAARERGVFSYDGAKHKVEKLEEELYRTYVEDE